ncbi:MAG: hypothetical protein DMF93_23810, partial [Acidobacteria bacterium]
MAERLVTLGRYGEAEEWVARAAQIYPYPGVVHFRVAQRLLAHDQSDAAIAHFETALQLDPSQAVADYALGETYLDAERPREAIPHLRNALDAGVRVDQAGYDLVRALGAAGDRAEAVRVLRTLRPARDEEVDRWVALALGVTLALTPTTIRNVVVSGYWSPLTSSHGGLNFYVGNNANADGTYRPVVGISPNMMGQQADTRAVAERATGRRLDDGGVSWYFYELAWTWMREHPMDAARLFARKLSLMFSAGYIWLNYSYPFFARDARTLLRLLLVGPWVLIPLGLVGFVVAAPGTRRWDYVTWASFVPLYGLAVAIFYVTDRYQLPILIPLCVGAGAAIDALATAVSLKRWRAVAIATAAFVVLLVWANRPLRLDDGVAEERIRMAERLVTLGRYGEAEEWVARAAQIYPYPGV